MVKNVICSRETAPPSAWTFRIRPIRDFLQRHMIDGGERCVDPFAGNNSPARYTNDQHPERRAFCHMDSEAYCQSLIGPFAGVLFDPPYSYRQVSEHYKELGRKARSLDTSANFYNRVMNAICDKIEPGGYALSFGWNSNGFGKNRGFELVEVLIVAHGQHHNDTICIAERKI